MRLLFPLFSPTVNIPGDFRNLQVLAYSGRINELKLKKGYKAENCFKWCMACLCSN
jgi:hypothetical protein